MSKKWKLREFHFGPASDPEKLKAAREAVRRFYAANPDAKRERIALEKATARNMLEQVAPEERDGEWLEMWNKSVEI